MLDSSQSRKHHEQDGKEDLAGAWETRTIGSGLRGHNDDQIRPLKPDNRPQMTKEYARQETEEEDALVQIIHKGALLCPVSETKIRGMLQNTDLVPSVRD